jgi:phosphate transport system protein
MGELVEKAVYKSLDALMGPDIALAEQVIAEDDVIDEMNMNIEERSLHMLATQQPVARDLRFISSILKIVIHLERIGDYAFNLAKISKRLKPGDEAASIQEIILDMSNRTKEVISDSVKVFKERDLDLAHALPEKDAGIDADFKKLIKELGVCLSDEACEANWSTSIILASRNIERMADHAVDVAEQVIFMVTGEMEELD